MANNGGEEVWLERGLHELRTPDTEKNCHFLLMVTVQHIMNTLHCMIGT